MSRSTTSNVFPRVADIFSFPLVNPWKLSRKRNLCAFEIYNAYSKEAQLRANWIKERLNKTFDFTIDALFTPDRRDADWPINKSAADKLWEDRLKYELLNELLSLASESEKDPLDLGDTIEPQTRIQIGLILINYCATEHQSFTTT